MTGRKRPGAARAREIVVKTAEEISRMRRAGQVVALTLERLAQAAQPGVTTEELDRLAEVTIQSFGATASFYNLYGYPARICTSVNDEVVHGIPGPRRLQAGDIISFDVGATVEGMIADGAATVGVGAISPEAERLLVVTREALHRGVREARAGQHVYDIARAVQQHGQQLLHDQGLGDEVNGPGFESVESNLLAFLGEGANHDDRNGMLRNQAP